MTSPPTATDFDHIYEILTATRDGDDLAPRHLKLVEHAVNGFLTAAGRANFNALLTNVRAGYKPAPYKLDRLDPDNCRTYYRGPSGARYAIQDDGTGSKPIYNFYACTEGGEPLWISHYPASTDFDPPFTP